MKNIAIITARSGSKGLPDKNVKLLCGKPLLYYSIKAALESKCFEKVMVSTDSKSYAEIAKEYGAEVPFMRSGLNSLDNSSSWDSVREVLTKYDEMGERFDTVTLLQPTSPLRNKVHIQNGYKLLYEKRADSITSVCEMDHSPLWSNTLENSLSLKGFIDKEIENLPRQSLPTYYRINGALYIREITYNNSEVFLKDDRPYAFIMPREFSIDIDTTLDFKLAEVMMQNE